MRGLKQQDFELFEDGVAQPIASFVNENAPLDLVLAVDISGSMESALADVKAAVKQLLSKLRPGDAATLVGFNDTLFVAAEREKDRQTREEAVDLLTSWGGTALYDATVRALDMVSREWGRKGVVIFSDGDDRHSLTPRETAMARVQASDAMLYTVGFGGGATVPALRSSLESYARSTRRARVLSPQTVKELDGVFDEIVAELANQYVLSYSSTNLKPDNAWRNIKVQVRKGKYDIRARRGYRRKRTAARRGGETMQALSGIMASGSGGVVAVRRAVALGATGPPRAGADVPQRRRGRHHRRRRRRPAGAAAARARAGRLHRDRRRAAAARRVSAEFVDAAPAARPDPRHRPDVVPRQHQRGGRHRPPVRVHRRSEHARSRQRAERRQGRVAVLPAAHVLRPIGADAHAGRPGRRVHVGARSRAGRASARQRDEQSHELVGVRQPHGGARHRQSQWHGPAQPSASASAARIAASRRARGLGGGAAAEWRRGRRRAGGAATGPAAERRLAGGGRRRRNSGRWRQHRIGHAHAGGGGSRLGSARTRARSNLQMQAESAWRVARR